MHSISGYSGSLTGEERARISSLTVLAHRMAALRLASVSLASVSLA